MWQAMAWKTWMEMPPRKMVRRGSHFRFSRKQRNRLRPSTRYCFFWLVERGWWMVRRSVTYAKHGETDGAECLEDDDDGEVDLETVDVVMVQIAVEPADEEIVENGKEDCRMSEGLDTMREGTHKQMKWHSRCRCRT
jgi:hypothetical protein